MTTVWERKGVVLPWNRRRKRWKLSSVAELPGSEEWIIFYRIILRSVRLYLVIEDCLAHYCGEVLTSSLD